LLYSLVFVPATTAGLWVLLVEVNGAAPIWDALTTALSLAAQYLLSRKRIESWYFWIAADVIYIPLYISRDLALTAVLYAVFLGMCVIGLIAWRRSMKEGNP
jgi:nicotinamide mononucleotide transporter